MPFRPDEEDDALTIEEPPHPSGEIIQQSQLQQAPNAAPTPVTSPDAFARGTPVQSDAEQAATPTPAPQRIAGASPEVEESATGNAFERQQVPEPLIPHRRASDDEEEARIQARDQVRAARQQAADQQEENKRAAGVIRGLKAAGVEIDTDPTTGEQRPKLGDDGKPLYKPGQLSPFEVDPQTNEPYQIRRGRDGGQYRVPLVPKTDPQTGEKYVTGEDGVTRYSMGTDEDFLAKRDAGAAGKEAAIARQRAAQIHGQEVAAKKRAEDLATQAMPLLADKNPSPETLVKLNGIQTQYQAALKEAKDAAGQRATLDQQAIAAAKIATDKREELLNRQLRARGIEPTEQPPAPTTAEAPTTPVSSAPPEKVATGSDFIRGAKVALLQMKPLAMGTLGLLGATAESATGGGGIASKVKQWGLQGYEDGMGKANAIAHENDDVTQAWEKAKAGDVGALVDWAQYGAGYLIGQAGESMGLALLGGLVGSAIGPEGTVAGAAAGIAQKQVVKAGIKGMIERVIAKKAMEMAEEQGVKSGIRYTEAELAETAASPLIRKAAAANVASNVGQGATLMANSFAQEAGGIFPDAVEQAHKEGRELTGTDMAKIWATSIGAAGVETVTDKLGLDVALGKLRLAKGRFGNAALTGLAGTVVEGGTEVAQTWLERLGAGQSLTDKEAQSDYLNSGLMGALGGTLIGGGGALIHGPEKAHPVMDKDNSKQDQGFVDRWNEDLKNSPGFTPITAQHAPAVRSLMSGVMERSTEELAPLVGQLHDATEAGDTELATTLQAKIEATTQQQADAYAPGGANSVAIMEATKELQAQPPRQQAVVSAAVKAANGHTLTNRDRAALIGWKDEEGNPVAKAVERAGTFHVELQPDTFQRLGVPKIGALTKPIPTKKGQQATTNANAPTKTGRRNSGTASSPTDAQGKPIPAAPAPAATPAPQGQKGQKGQTEGQDAELLRQQIARDAEEHDVEYQGAGTDEQHNFLDRETGGNFSIPDGQVTKDEIGKRAKALREEFAKNPPPPANEVEAKIRKAQEDAAKLDAERIAKIRGWIAAGETVTVGRIAEELKINPATAKRLYAEVQKTSATPPVSASAESAPAAAEKPVSHVGLPIEGPWRQTILDAGAKIADADLYNGEDGADSFGPEYGRETEPHITAFYGLHDQDPEAVQKILADFGPLKVRLGAVTLFENEGKPYDVVKIDVLPGEDLTRLNAALRKLPNSNEFPEYHPHITLAYVKKGQGAKYVGKQDFTGREITLGKAIFSNAEREKTPLKMAGEQLPNKPAPQQSKVAGEQRAPRLVNQAMVGGKVKAALDALKVTIKRESVGQSFRAHWAQSGDTITYALTINEARIEERTAGMTDEAAAAYLEKALGEELIHFAQFEAVRRAGTNATFADRFESEYAAVAKALGDEEREASGKAYGDGWEKLTPEAQAAEFVRQLIQTGVSGTPTEATIRAKPIVERILAVLRGLLDDIKSAPKALQQAYERTKSVLDEIEGRIVKAQLPQSPSIGSQPEGAAITVHTLTKPADGTWEITTRDAKAKVLKTETFTSEAEAVDALDFYKQLGGTTEDRRSEAKVEPPKKKPAKPQTQEPLGKATIAEMRGKLDQAERWGAKVDGLKATVDDYERGTWTLQDTPPVKATEEAIELAITNAKRSWAVNNIEPLGKTRTRIIGALSANPLWKADTQEWLKKQQVEKEVQKWLADQLLTGELDGLHYDHFFELTKNEKWQESVLRQLQKQEAAPVEPPKKKPAKPAPAGQVLGKNAVGMDVRVDQNGARYVEDGGIRRTQSVALRPTRGPDGKTVYAMAPESPRELYDNFSRDYLTTEEVEKFKAEDEARKPKAKPPAIPPKPESAGNGPIPEPKYKAGTVMMLKGSRVEIVTPIADTNPPQYLVRLEGSSAVPMMVGETELTNADEAPPVKVEAPKSNYEQREEFLGRVRELGYIVEEENPGDSKRERYRAVSFYDADKLTPWFKTPAELLGHVQSAAPAPTEPKPAKTAPKPAAPKISDEARKGLEGLFAPEPNEPLKASFKGRIADLEQANRDLRDKKITREQYDALSQELKPVNPLTSVPRPPSDARIKAALASNKVPFVGANRDIPAGTPVGLRIDIPAFKKTGDYVVTIHNRATKSSVGARIGYDGIARVKNPTFFITSEKASQKIATGETPKAPLATVEGEFIPSREIPSDIMDWTQAGYDPERHGYFYDRQTGEAVVGGDEAVSIGNTVFVKNAVHGDKSLSLYSPEPTDYKTALPRDKAAKFQAVAFQLLDDGIDTPEKMAAALDEMFQGRQRPFSDKLWRTMENVGAPEKTADWPAIYGAIDEAANQPETQPEDNHDADTQPNDDQGNPPAGGGVKGGVAGDERADGGTDGVLEDGAPEDDGDAATSGGTGGVRKVPGGRRGQKGAGATQSNGPAGGGGGIGGSQGSAADDAGNVGAGGRQSGAGGSVGSGGSAKPSDPLGTAGGRQPTLIEGAEKAQRGNYHMTNPERLVGGGPKDKFRRNIAALQTYQKVIDENREPTDEELDAIASYIGWGSFGQELFGIQKDKEGTKVLATWENPASKPEWKKEDAQLRELLGKEEWESARSSIINAHYTDPPTVSTMWQMARAMGFKGGRLLEAGFGIGNFAALMPRDLMSGSRITGIELDIITSRMAQMLYPDVNVQNKDFADSRTADGFYDMTIGNFPFHANGPADRRYNHLQPSLHDFFFLKSLDQTRPGGLVMAITSAGTMDKKTSLVRMTMERKAELVAAFRLPAGAFKQYAGTGVVTDIVILRKRGGEGGSAIIPVKWQDSVEVETPTGKVFVNEYFRDHPQNVLGDLRFDNGTTIGRAGMYVARKADFEERMAELPEIVARRANFGDPIMGERTVKADEPSYVSNNTADRQGALVDIEDVKKRTGRDPETDLNWAGGAIVEFPDKDMAQEAMRKEMSKPGARQNFTWQVVRRTRPSGPHWDVLYRPISTATVPPGFYIVKGDHLVKAEDIIPWRVKDEKKNAVREDQMRRLVKLRRAIGGVLDAQRKGAADRDKLRASMRTQYDEFVKKHGAVAVSLGVAYLKKIGDPFYTRLANIEKFQDGKWVPRDILTKDILRSGASGAVDNVRDAFAIERNRSLNIDMDRIALDAKTTREAAAKELMEAGAVFHTPADTYEASDVYLSGNVRQKLREAEDGKTQGIAGMERNIEALKAVVPKNIPYFSIEAKLGASWVPANDYHEFIRHLLNLSEEDGKAFGFRKGINGWKFEISDSGRWILDKAEAKTLWGFGDGTHFHEYAPGKFSDGISFRKLFDAAVNNAAVRIERDGISDLGNKTVELDVDATKAANAQIEKLRDEFARWVWNSSPLRTTRLENNYNEVFNSIAIPKYDGSHLRFEGLALERGKDAFSFRKHQVDAVWRGVVTGRGIYAHEVGTGKTYTMAGLALESRRLGVARKPIIFAHNANASAVAKDIQQAYPGAKVLFVNSKDMGEDKINATLQQIGLDDWDAVVVPHSLISRFSLKPETLRELVKDQIAELEQAAIEAAAEDEAGTLDIADMDDPEKMRKFNSRTAKELVAERNKIKKKIDEASQKADENGVFFEDMGVDMVMVDEAHIFKKIALATRQKVKGLNKSSSNRGAVLGLLTDYVKSANNGRGVHLFSGTPITNTVNEIYNMMRYVMDDVMKRDGVKRWDDWFGNFAGESSDVELTAGGTWENVQRLSQFVNIPELRQMAGQVLDIVFADSMPEFTPRKASSGLTYDDKDKLTDKDRDELMNGRSEDPVGRPYKKVKVDIAPMTPLQEAHKLDLMRRAQTFAEMKPKEKKASILAGDEYSPIIIEGEGVKGAMDMRLLNIHNPDEANSKENRVVKNVLTHYHENPKATQMVFMQVGISNTADKSKIVGRDTDGKAIRQKWKVPAYSIAHGIRDKLIAQGVKPEEIAIFSELPNTESKTQWEPGMPVKNRSDAALAMQSGLIRVAIGSTETMGTGVNAQNELRAMHHIDAPWMPGDLEQRNGRGWRQGNKWNSVLEYRYLTEASHDGRRWQILLIKDKFIKMFMRAKDDLRVIDGDGVNLDEGEGGDEMPLGDDMQETFAKAAGDPRILQREKLRKDIDRLQDRQRIHVQGLANAEQEIGKLGEWNSRARQQLTKMNADLAKWEEEKQKPFGLDLLGEHYADRENADKALDEKVKERAKLPDVAKDSQTVNIGSYRGFPITLHSYYGNIGLEVGGYSVNQSTGSMDANLRGIATKIKQGEDQVVENLGSINSLRERLTMPFSRQKELDAKQKRLAQIEADLSASPTPAPSWLRDGASVGTLVYVDGKEYEVAGHKWNDHGLYVQVATADGARDVSFDQINDESGAPMFSERTFEPPPKIVTTPPGGASAPTPAGPGATPNGFTAGQIVEIDGYNGPWKIDRIIPGPSDKPAQWSVEATVVDKDGKSQGHTEIVTADRLRKAGNVAPEPGVEQTPNGIKVGALVRSKEQPDELLRVTSIDAADRSKDDPANWIVKVDSTGKFKGSGTYGADELTPTENQWTEREKETRHDMFGTVEEQKPLLARIDALLTQVRAKRATIEREERDPSLPPAREGELAPPSGGLDADALDQSLAERESELIKRRALIDRIRVQNAKEGVKEPAGQARSEDGELHAPEPDELKPTKENPLVSAFRELPPAVKRVLAMKAKGSANDEIAKVVNMTPERVQQAYDAGVDKLARARTALTNLPAAFRQAQEEQEGARTIGRPELANVAVGPSSRRFMDTVDQAREDAGIPMRKSDEIVMRDARARLNSSADWRREKTELMRKALAGEVMSDVDTVVARKIVAKEALAAVQSGKPGRMLEAAVLIDAYRSAGTEAARAFRQRHDWTKSPSERLHEYVAQTLLTPPKRQRERLEDLWHEINEAPRGENGDAIIEKANAERERILTAWAGEVEGLKKKLAALQFDMDSMTEAELKAELAKPAKAARVVREIAAAKADAWDALYEYWVSAVLSAPATQIANIVGNTAASAWDFTAQRLTEALVNLGARDPAAAQLGEFTHIARGILPGLAMGARNFLKAWQTELPTFEEEVTGHEGDLKVEGHRTPAIGGTKGRIIRTPLRLLLAADEFAKSLTGRMQVGAEAYRMAKAEGMSGTAMSARMEELMELGSPAWFHAAAKAKQLAFQDELGNAGKSLIQAKSGPGVLPGILRYVFPFVQTIANIFKIGLRKTPLGSVSLLYRLGRQGLVKMGYDASGWHYNRSEFVQHAAEQLLGWAIFLALKGYVEPDESDLPIITGTTPFSTSSRGERDLAYRTAPPMSVRIGDEWYSYSRIEPAATALGVMVDALNSLREAKNGAEYTATLGKLFAHLTAQVKDKTFARGIADILNAIEDGQHAVEWAGNFATSWVPNIIKSGAREADDAIREQKVWGRGEAWGDRLANRLEYKALPLEANAPPPKVDLWGREITKDTGATPATDWLWRMFAPTRSQPGNKVEDVDRLILNWNNQNPTKTFAPQAPPPTLAIKSVPQPDGSKRKETIYMTDAEYNEFLKRSGTNAFNRLKLDAMNPANPRQEDLESINSALKAARKEARTFLWERRLAQPAASVFSNGPSTAPPATPAR